MANDVQFEQGLVAGEGPSGIGRRLPMAVRIPGPKDSELVGFHQILFDELGPQESVGRSRRFGMRDWRADLFITGTPIAGFRRVDGNPTGPATNQENLNLATGLAIQVVSTEKASNAAFLHLLWRQNQVG